MAIKIPDTFYEPYSLSIDFGHSSKQEIQFIRSIIKERGFHATDANIKDSLNFIKEIAFLSREKNTREITVLERITKKEKITGGFVPPDISIAYHTYHTIIDLAGYGVTTFDLADRLSGDRITKTLSVALSKLIKNQKGKKLIKNQ